ncbi:MAG: 50S ribosomal protein L21 [Chloroflexi bacterium AL-W]|nr:50S ribosomal protein L21 [Chloroflexi bacterium AL-N1]NOK67000.1 50S ribosomal protein L21 [Chloroflexi bacterium AL-N10]NOK74708.1 50S ribosomal protein L21 [Chloroflexi bacterium AL-N5]NOK81602.1 50S ribosomal protein L21 [Chloroflexi bacterium AL-W]NOK89072.1 50S ribosomal protein L21 [Chloroflexi bacterium AL-N15]
MYAIIRDRGMQYRVEEGQQVNIALLDAEPGSQIELNEVLFIGGEETKVGNPLVADAKVVATVLGDGKDKKIIVFKYKNKKRYRRRTGHRQGHTRITIDHIVGQTEKPKTRSKKSKPAETETDE